MKGVKLLFGAALLMVLGFGVHVAVDYLQYSGSLHSAPFRIWICVDALIWLVPAALAFAAGLTAKKKQKTKEKTNDYSF